jgi:nicotinamidase/pyrazinamidase
MKALILVDLQNDFMPGGALAVRDGDATVGVANRLLGSYALVVATQDWHPPEHRSFAMNNPGRSVGELGELEGLPQVMWPAHCVQGTRGAELHADLDKTKIHAVFPKGTDPAIDSYSGFADNGHRRSTGLGEFLKARGVTSVDVLGLATDYCVKFTALDALHEGLRVRLLREGCRAVDLTEGDGERAIAELRAAGVEVV